ncbi:MAG TPA: hypothetical protein VHT91_23430, partial [Kofleriaceae bacterium]|nr:hypothetical protein [Kofleriaceae bacterium]
MGYTLLAAADVRGPAVLALLAAAALAGVASGAPERAAVLDALSSEDRGRLERAVAAVAAPGDADPDVLFAAARACEDKLGDPGRAVALYDRIAGEYPSARVAAAAVRRAAALRALIGPHGETAALAGELAQLIAHADATPAGEVIR